MELTSAHNTNLLACPSAENQCDLQHALLLQYALCALEFNAHHFASKSTDVHSSPPTTKLAAASLRNRNFVVSSLRSASSHVDGTSLHSLQCTRDAIDIYMIFILTAEHLDGINEIYCHCSFRCRPFLSFPTLLHEKNDSKKIS